MYDLGFAQEQPEMLGREISIRARLGVQLDESRRDLGNNVRQTGFQEVRMLGTASVLTQKFYMKQASKQMKPMLL